MSELTTISDSIRRLDGWLTQNSWKAFDPFDGLNANLSNVLTFDTHYLRIILQQSVRRFPLNLRPLLGVKKETSSKGMGFCALGYLKLYEGTGDTAYLEKMRFCLEWLIKNYSDGYSGYAWGNHFSYESRGGRIPLGVPTIVWTSLIANAFLDAFELLKEQRYFDVARSAGDFIVNDIGRYEESGGSFCFMYTPQGADNPTSDGCVHNSNVLGAWLLSRLYAHTREDAYLSLAKGAMAYTLKHQLPDGGWYYGEPRKYRWVDSFHTGYVLDSILGYIQATGDRSHEEKLLKGYSYFKKTFFKQDGTPRYYNHKTYPIDIQCASQGIQTLATFADHDPSSVELAKQVALWTIKHMQNRDGYFYFRKYPVVTNKTPMFHWGQATMLSALAHLLAN